MKMALRKGHFPICSLRSHAVTAQDPAPSRCTSRLSACPLPAASPIFPLSRRSPATATVALTAASRARQSPTAGGRAVQADCGRALEAVRSVDAAHHAPGGRKGLAARRAALVRARSTGREPVPTACALGAALVLPARARHASQALAARVAQPLPLLGGVLGAPRRRFGRS